MECYLTCSGKLRYCVICIIPFQQVAGICVYLRPCALWFRPMMSASGGGPTRERETTWREIEVIAGRFMRCPAFRPPSSSRDEAFSVAELWQASGQTEDCQAAHGIVSGLGLQATVSKKTSPLCDRSRHRCTTISHPHGHHSMAAVVYYVADIPEFKQSHRGPSPAPAVP